MPPIKGPQQRVAENSDGRVGTACQEDRTARSTVITYRNLEDYQIESSGHTLSSTLSEPCSPCDGRDDRPSPNHIEPYANHVAIDGDGRKDSVTSASSSVRSPVSLVEDEFDELLKRHRPTPEHLQARRQQSMAWLNKSLTVIDPKLV